MNSFSFSSLKLRMEKQLISTVGLKQND